MLCLDDSALASAKTEVTVMSAISHPNSVAILRHEIVEDVKRSDENYPNPYVMILCPLYEGGNLEEFVNEGGMHETYGDASSTEKVAIRLLKGVASGLVAVGVAGYRHNDVKPANVLLRPGEGEGSPLPTPAVTDFGSCGPAEVPITSRREALTAMDFHSRCTTAPYRAPELWDIPSSGTTLTLSSDAFSLGCVLYFMLFGKVRVSESRRTSQSSINLV